MHRHKVEKTTTQVMKKFIDELPYLGNVSFIFWKTKKKKKPKKKKKKSAAADNTLVFFFILRTKPAN
jgi:hypothetical protein